MSFGYGKSIGFDVLEAAMGCLQALSKVSVDEEVRNELLGKIFQSFGEVHNKAVHNDQRKMDGSKLSGDKEHAQGHSGNQSMVQESFHQQRKEHAQSQSGKPSMVQQNFQQQRSMEEVRISSIFASLSEAVSQGALDIKDFFSVVTLIEESVLKNAWNNEHAKNGILTVFHEKSHENGRNVKLVNKDKDAGLPYFQNSYMELMERNAAAKEELHVGVHGNEGTISRKHIFSNGTKEMEDSFCPRDKSLPVNAIVVASQDALVHAPSSHDAFSSLQRTSAVHPSCMAAGKVRHMSSTLPHTSSTSNILNKPISNPVATFSENLENGEREIATHVTPTLSPQSNTENLSSTEDTLGKSRSKPLSFLEAAQKNCKGSPRHIQNKGGKLSQTKDSSSNNAHIFKIDKEVFQKRMELCRFSILGKLTLAKGEEPWTWYKLKDKLDALWQLNSQWRLISIGKGFFQIILTNQEEYDRVWSKEVLLLHPGVLRLQCWKFGFDPSMVNNTKAQLWFRFFQLPWCLWDSSVIWGIASKIGQPIRIDKQTLEGNFGHYARVLIEVDLTHSIKSSVLVECNDQFLEVQTSPEAIPLFCTGCNAIGHSINECRRFVNTEATSKSLKSVDPPLGSKRDHKDIGMESAFGASTSKTNVQHSEWRKKKVQVINNGKTQLAGNNNIVHAIVETVTDFSAQGASHSPKTKRTDALALFNQFAALEKEVEDVEMVVDTTLADETEIVVESSSINQESQKKNDDGDATHTHQSPNVIQEVDMTNDELEESYDQNNEIDIDIPKIPDRWSDLIEEEDAAENSCSPQDHTSSSMETSSKFERTYGDISGFRENLHEDCIWLNHDDDHKYDRDMCVEIERFKNSAKATRNFIANLPKKDKKLKIAFSQPQRKACSPKQ